MYKKIWFCALVIIGIINLVVATSMQLGKSIERDNVLRACTSAGEIEMTSGVLRISIKCNINGVNI